LQIEELRKICRKIKINTNYQYDTDVLIRRKMVFLAQNAKKILDIGKSSREWYDHFSTDQIITLDVNQYGDYPDILDDICNLQKIQGSIFDGIICMSILEHVYSPESAVNNIFSILKDGGYVFSFIPFLYRYHAPDDLKYQDFYRFSKDGIAYLFRNFSNVILYPVRGKYSTIMNINAIWKFVIEKKFGEKLNKLIDRIFGNSNEKENVSGFYIWAKK